MNQKVKMKPSYLKIAFLDRDGTLIKDYPDEKWREMLRENQAPAQPEWTRPYTVKEAVFWW